VTARTPEHLFVYGTLRRGESRWPYLVPFLDGEPVPDTVRGQLFDTRRGYPAAVFDGAGTIVGDVGLLDAGRREAALALLDEIEGAVHDLYRRVVVRTASGVHAWAYEFVGEPAFAPIASGDWVKRTG
jgi:gamma-glutamylcyclotransferase (GGCT)/AIG2-like uncharacterized protein YtfP